jgi:very-short-patch-repair endonuclease
MHEETPPDWERWNPSPAQKRRMRDAARESRRNPTPSEVLLWQAIRRKQLDGRRFRRQVAIGPFIVDFYCPAERLAVEVDGPIHKAQKESDRTRQELIESLGIRFVRVTAEQVERDMPKVLEAICSAFENPPSPDPSPTLRGGRGTVGDE